MHLAKTASRAPVVAVVDSGVSTGHEVFACTEFGPGAGFSPDGPDVVEESTTSDVHGHGTAIASIIVWHAPEARILPVRVLDHQLRSRGDALASAIEWSVLHGADIVNVSADTEAEAHRGALEQVVRLAADAGVLIVASAGRFGANSMPACLDGVCSVGPAVLRDSRQWIHKAGETPEFLAQAGLQVVAAPEGYSALSGASCAAAHISGIASQLWARRAESDDPLPALLREMASSCDEHDETYVVQSRSAIAPRSDLETIGRHGPVFATVMDVLSRYAAVPLEWDALLGVHAVERSDIYPAIREIQARLGVSVSPLDCAGLAIASPYAIGMLMIDRVDALLEGAPATRV